MYMLQSIAKYELCALLSAKLGPDSEERRTSTYQYANRNVPIPNETQNPNMCTPFWEKFQNDDLISQQLEEGPRKALRI